MAVNEEKYDAEKVLDTYVEGRSWLAYLTAPFRVVPHIFLLGVQKSGTSSLYRALLQHPAILPAKRKEIFYFGNDVHYRKGLNWYRQFFALRIYCQQHNRRHGVQSLSIDASTNSFDHAQAPERIHALVPGAKLIVLLRNPTDRAYSHYLMSKRLGYEHASFAEALRLEDSRLANIVNHPLYISGNNNPFQRLGYRTRGLYARYLHQWYARFPSKQVLVLNSHDFATDTEGVYIKVLNFLELEKQKKFNFEKINVSPRHAPMEPEVREELETFYAPHNRKLFELIGQTYEW